MSNFYEEDLAYVHDDGFSNFAHEASKMIIDTLRAHSLENGLIIDLGCGSGIVARVLADNNYKVLGVDKSKSLLNIAEQRVPEADFTAQSFFDVTLPTCQAIVSTSECFNYLDEKEGEVEALPLLFKRAYEALEHGGVFIFDMIGPGNRIDKKYFIEKEDWTMFVHVCEDNKKNELTRDVTLFRKINEHYRKSKELHRVKLYPHQMIIQWLKNVGFKVQPFEKYNNLFLDENHYGYFCIKSK
ncbi:trans-aconitate 2-methyltransferase [Legionella pneumophila]|uniref:class I SAM-dependent methyltransferase n=1 Tax=Legionella pneumophila TaxID=446 RepID=UPI00077071A0|nr:class I SAM-dependent methyltransferase [Legionella pneumophila]CZG39549.1 trans-aconitate 2-methyltransferase [Legionella pneumophila]CZH40634.1 trans-aconitate 2-methyltransferase [Legionella pneumophila]